MYDVAVIGCGIVGAACAYTLSKYDLSVLILERENDIEDKLIVTTDDKDYSIEEIKEKINFQEKYFKYKIFK